MWLGPATQPLQSRVISTPSGVWTGLKFQALIETNSRGASILRFVRMDVGPTLPSPERTGPSILSLPNEILLQILSIVLDHPNHPSDQDEFPTDIFRQHPKPAPTPTLVIRAVCRTFRAISNELPFWIDPAFDFTNLLSRHNVSTSHQQTFLKSLFSDTHLVQRLQKRTHWEFRNRENLLAVLECIPSFPQCALSVNLSAFLDDILKYGNKRSSALNLGIQDLAVCSYLTSLEVQVYCGILDLSLIPQSCPSLSNLVLLCETTDLILRGSLENLASLRRLELDLTPNIYAPSLRLFPVNSANILTTLVIGVRPRSGPDPYNINILDTFINLTSLHFEPLSSQICKFILRSSLNLTTFYATVDSALDVTNEMVVDILSSYSVRQVQNITLKIPTNSQQDLSGIQQIIHAITSKLLRVHRCELQMGLDLNWCYQFANLVYLKTFIYKIQYVDTAFRFLNGNIDSDYHGQGSPAEEAFQMAFAHFPEKPRIVIQEIYSLGHWNQVDEAEDGGYIEMDEVW